MLRFSLSSFADQLFLAFQGLLLAFRKKSFLISFIVCFLVFGTLLNLLSTGLSSFRLLFSGSFSVLLSAFLGIFGVGKAPLDWLLNFLLTLAQSVLISFIIYLSLENKSKSHKKPADNYSTSSLESSALVAGLIVLGSGCPTCGTTLLAPLLTTLLSGASGSLALAGTLSLVLNLLALILALFAFRRLGLTTYATIVSDNRKNRIGS